MKAPVSLKILSISLIIWFVISCGAQGFSLYATFFTMSTRNIDIDIFNSIQTTIVGIAYVGVVLVAALAMLKGKFWGKVLFIGWAIPKFLQLMFKAIIFIRYEEYSLAILNSMLSLLILIGIYIVYRPNNRQYFNELQKS
ncbi:hypothetical protein BMT54_05415 [Pasteurellaceae bacterium 15-036681]|nr:hypothetical protein BMT54_05415 [Pasteurellaceae bacterium 15-036681]